MSFPSKFSPENAGVYELLSKLCENTAAEYCLERRVSQRALSAKLRSQCYEIILKRSPSEVPASQSDPFIDLLSHHFVSLQTVKNVAEFKRATELKKLISRVRCTDFGEQKELVHKVLKFLISLKNSSQKDLSNEMFQQPFSFGLLDEMLPKPKQEAFGSPEPYSYYPSYVFELPYSLKQQGSHLSKQKSQCYTEVTVESFNSRGFLPDSGFQSGIEHVNMFLSPMSMASLTTTEFTPYSDSMILNFPRLNEARDLKIPSTQSTNDNVKVSLASTSILTDVKEDLQKPSMDIWELASQVDKDIPEDIWDIVAKLPPIQDRPLMADSTREMALWRRSYGDRLHSLSVISERQFIRHVMYLITGVETSSFPFNKESNRFYMKEGLVLECVSRERLSNYVGVLLLVGTFYRRLYNFAFDLSHDDYFHTKGLVFEAAREAIRRYLLEFRLVATGIYEECCNKSTDEHNFMPTLLQILYHVEPLQYELETIASIYKVVDVDSTCMPRGAELMSYLFNEISLVTHRQTAHTLYNALFTICAVYFKFIERFIFEGELDDVYEEFFIRRDNNFVNSRSKRYWDKGFHIALGVAVPDFLRQLAAFILLCGKSFRLLKQCNPSDPLVLLISSDHPSVRCCASFEELERQQQLLDVYRTRCLFVSGEPVTFEQILLKREAERKAFAEMASLKQAETMEKIVAERKRLAQLIIAEKQHSLRVLEAAMAEAKAAKNKAKKRERKLCELEEAADKTTEEVDSKLRDDERSKMMEYYSKLNMEVEKSKIHTEWKIKRLQLDESRMQLLSTEERNLKREKLEMEHQRNESVMAMSIQSDFKPEDDLDNVDNNNGETENASKTTDSTPSIEILGEAECSNVSEQTRNKQKSQTSTDVFNAICNVAKSFFGVSKSKHEKPCDNEVEVDAQGNVVADNAENTRETKKTETSNNAIGRELDNRFDNLQFLQRNQEALKNKEKVMSHEFGQTDADNNRIKNPLMKTTSLDKENNVEEEWSPAVEAKRNKLKVLGVEFDVVKSDKVTEPITDAQKEAVINKQKVLGVEYNLPSVRVEPKQPANIAQEEALQNKNKILGAECENKLPSEKVEPKQPANIAQEEAVRNRNKILGAECENSHPYAKFEPKQPANIAQEEALRNRNKNLGAECENNDPTGKIEPKHLANIAQEEAVRNRNKILGAECKNSHPYEKFEPKQPANIAQEEALRNRKKILGAECENNDTTGKFEPKHPANIAQEAALRNRNKILGAECENNGPTGKFESKQPANIAQEEALRNRNRVLGSEHENSLHSPKKYDSAKKTGLRLNLKPYSETTFVSPKLSTTPNTGAITPGELYSKLDLETPTTADIPVDGGLTSDIFTPRSEGGKDFDSGKDKQDKQFLNSSGFNFSMIEDDENAQTDVITEASPENSPCKIEDFEIPRNNRRTSVFNIIDGSYNLDSFDPFGVKNLQNYSKDYFTKKINSDSEFYTHPAVTMEEVKKKPYTNIFASHVDADDNRKVSCDNIATLTACLQRSVMLPLTYQLEVVNNSILTHFLVNLDMYEHLRSLKDYFFLMDGEFSRSICHNLFAKLTKTLNPQELLNFATLHNILDKALGSSISHVHKFSENLSFTITEPPLSFQHSSPDVLQCLSLTYCVRWPLNIILSQEALLRYAKVFQFLVKMRRIFWVLSEDFESLKLTAKLSKHHSRKLCKSPQYISVQLHRHNMASLIRALDNYIVTTCILTSWTEFEKDLQKARTLDDLYECHVVYIKKVLFRCLLNNRSMPVNKLLNDIFTVVLKFSRVLKAGEWLQKEPNGYFTHTSYAQLKELYHLFEKIAKYLHKVITKLMECGYQRHLVELLTLINLNGYYDPEKYKEDSKASVQTT